jgi:hypothetical protein
MAKRGSIITAHEYDIIIRCCLKTIKATGGRWSIWWL